MTGVNNSMRGGRDIRIDIIKGISILLVLWGHAIQNLSPNEAYYGDWIFKTIYSFHMPLFALISGYLFYFSQRKRSFWDVLRSRISDLLVPIVVWTTVDWMLGIVLHKKIVITQWMTIFIGMMLWFLWSILAANFVLTVAEKKIKSRWGRLIWLIAGFFMMYLFPNPEMNLFLYPYVVLGFYYKKYGNSFAKIKKYGWISILLFILLLPFFDEASYIYTTGISLWKVDIVFQKHILIDVYRYIIGLIGSITVIYAVCVMHEKFKIGKVFSICGRYTMQIYIMQCFFFKVFGMIWGKIACCFADNYILINNNGRDIVIAIPFSLILLVICLFISKLLERNKILNKMLFGR